jgi:hypothetical protein
MQKKALIGLSILVTLLDVSLTRLASATSAARQKIVSTSIPHGNGLMTGNSSSAIAKACTQRRYRRPH